MADTPESSGPATTAPTASAPAPAPGAARRPATQTAERSAPSPQAYGVGARISLHPMTDAFAQTILAALAQTDQHGLEITTDDVSTFVRGP